MRPRTPFRSAHVAPIAASAVLLFIGVLTTAASSQNGAPAAKTTAATPSPGLPAAWTRFEDAWAGVASYGATVTVYEQKATAAQNVVFDYTFKKPSTVTVHVEKGTNSGVTLDWSGGPTIVAHRGSGFAALFKKSYALHDAAVTTIRGSSIDELSFAAILQHLKSTPGTVSEAPGPAIDGVTTEAVTLVPAAPDADAGFTSEVVDLLPTTAMPASVLGYDGTTLVRKIDFANVQLQR